MEFNKEIATGGFDDNYWLIRFEYFQNVQFMIILS